MKRSTLLTLLIAVLMASPVMATGAQKGNSKSAKTASKSQKTGKKSAKSNTKDSGLGTDFDFEDMSVNGKYQYADEAIAAVEDEKILEDLLAPRSHFRDRLKKETKRR